MNPELKSKVKEALEKKAAVEEIRSGLVSQGFIEDEVIDAIHELQGDKSESRHNSNLLTVKEVLDRIGYGFASTQFINILFNLIGAGYFLIGIVNGLRTVISLLISSFIQEYSKFSRVSKKFMSKAGILFGLSFLFIALAVAIKSVPLFAVAFLLGGIGVVTYGDLYKQLVDKTLKKEKMSGFLRRISHYGVLITAVSFILSGFLFDMFPVFNTTRVMLLGRSMPLYGYLIAFEITAIAFILSGYVLQHIKEKKSELIKAKGFVSDYIARIKEHAGEFLKNKYLLTLLVASVVTGLVQVLGNSYYGIFIYKQFNFMAFGGFLNVAVIYAFAIVVSFLGPAFSRYLNKRVGLAPTLVFGTLLLAMMPLVAAFNPHFMSVSFANAFSVLGAAILGMSQGLLVRKLLREEQRKIYFATLSIMVIVPFIILIPLGSWIAQSMGLVFLFKVLAGILLLIAAPVYFALVVMANKLRL